MSDRLDDRIRELYSELTEAAPDVPPLRAPAPRTVPIFARPAVWAGAAAVVAVVVGLGFLIQSVDLAGDDDAAATTRAPATTAATTAATSAAPATTAAPTTAAATTTTVGAPATTSVGEPTDGTTGAPRDPSRVLLLAALNLTCSDTATSYAGIGNPTTEDEFRAAFVTLFDGLEEIRVVVENADPSLGDELLELADEIVFAQGAVILGGDDPAAPRYSDARQAIDELGLFLEEYGAIDCGGLGHSIP